jgi:diadenosine tetraphosphate (Ap4A) HIT family hydrolase
MKIFENDLIFIELHQSSIPWFKIFTKRKIKEFSQCTKEEKTQILDMLDYLEKELIAFYNPAKINIAQFGNYLPHLHWHIMARFEDDGYFPEPMWGKKQKEELLNLPDIQEFIKTLNFK